MCTVEEESEQRFERSGGCAISLRECHGVERDMWVGEDITVNRYRYIDDILLPTVNLFEVNNVNVLP